MTAELSNGPRRSEFSLKVDAALFAERKRTMNGCAREPANGVRLGRIGFDGGWFWLHCCVCLHRVAVPGAPLTIWLGPDYPLCRLREKAWCTECGCFGAATMHRGW